MKNHLFMTAICTACLALGAQAQVHSGTSTDTRSSYDSSSKPSTWDRIKDLAATGRTQHEVRASQLTSAQVMSSTSESVGTISDIIISPASGKVDFAVVSLSGSSSASPGPGTRSDTSATSTAGGKQVVVPWSLLHAANTGSSTTSFTYSGDVIKLQSAPAFDPNTDMTRPGWIQSVSSYFGISGTATGGATSPGSSSSGTSSGNPNRSYPDGNPSRNP
jgi:sporulation protein YlmC with PRC-barrel domain